MQPKNKILFVINPIAGDSDKDECRATIQQIINDDKFEVKTYETTGKKDLEKINATIKSFNPSRVLVAGGDGTVQLVAKVIKGTSIIMGILPLGSANGLALNLDIPPDIKEQVHLALYNKPIDIDTLIVNDTTCLHIADIGINAALIENYEQSQIRGKLGYLLQTLPTLWQEDYPFSFTIEANGKTWHRQGILLAIANANKFGTGANINPQGQLQDGKFEILIFKKLDLIQILKTLYQEINVDSDFVEMICTQEATIHCEHKTAFQIDGEFVGRISQIHAKMGTDKLKIAVPHTLSKN